MTGGPYNKTDRIPYPNFLGAATDGKTITVFVIGEWPVSCGIKGPRHRVVLFSVQVEDHDPGPWGTATAARTSVYLARWNLENNVIEVTDATGTPIGHEEYFPTMEATIREARQNAIKLHNLDDGRSWHLNEGKEP